MEVSQTNPSVTTRPGQNVTEDVILHSLTRKISDVDHVWLIGAVMWI